MNRAIRETLGRVLRGRVAADEPLAAHTSWRVGGPADLYLVPADAEDLAGALRELRTQDVPWVVLGAGSNVLVRDGGFRGAVIDTRELRDLQIELEGRVTAGAGLRLSTLVQKSAERGFAGVEELVGIPGTVGGAVAMNAGAGAQEIGDVLHSVIVATAEGVEEYPCESLRLAYRRAALPEGGVVAAARLQLRRDSAERLSARLEARRELRRQAQPVSGANAGSVFKNPPGHSAWKLIDGAGLRGTRQGGAQVAEEHANFIVNDGSASAGDIESLIGRVREAVQSRYGILMETEVRILGEPACLAGESGEEQGTSAESRGRS